jgi:vacuolar-type H+-ATPase subunit H
MSSDSTRALPDAVNGQAIDEVLQAERAAEQAVARCERQARDIVRDAQTRAQRIAERGDERITLIHMRCSQWLAEQCRLLAVADKRAQSEIRKSAVDSATIRLVADKLAAALTGTDTEAS